MLKSDANISIKNLNAELFSLNPSALITLFTIDITDLAFNQGIASQSDLLNNNNLIFRFHNTINVTSKSIFWQGQEYIAAPIQAVGFETSVKGTPPTPKLSLSVSDEGIAHLARLKDRIYQLGDIVGGKLNRIRTFAKFLDSVNFLNGIPPQNFFPDPNSELPRDIYFIDRKSNENKNFLEYELSPLFELEGIKLPGRLVSQNNCSAQYRCEGCLYEYSNRKNNDIHGDGILPQNAPPIATSFNEPINTLITGVPFIDKGAYNINQVYNKGEFCFIQHRGVNYYFVSKIDNNATSPPDSSVWIADECSKKLLGCKLRWGNIGNGVLPFNAFPSVTRFK